MASVLFLAPGHRDLVLQLSSCLFIVVVIIVVVIVVVVCFCFCCEIGFPLHIPG